jgi:hypothetical protein
MLSHSKTSPFPKKNVPVQVGLCDLKPGFQARNGQRPKSPEHTQIFAHGMEVDQHGSTM